MYKQNVQLKSESHDVSKSLEIVSQKLENIKLEPTTQVSKVLAISRAPEARLVSKNNHRTPIKDRFTVSPIDSIPRKTNRRNRLTYKNVTTTDKYISKVDSVDSKKENSSENDKEPPQKTTNGTSSIPSSASSVTKEEPKVPKIVKPDPRTVCTCELLKQTAPAPVPSIPKKPVQNTPIYRWVAVKDESQKTEAERAAEIRELLQATQPQNVQTTSTANTRRKPRLCQFCWSNVKKAEREREWKRERELLVAQQTKKKTKPKDEGPKRKTNNQITNRFGFLDEESA